jgi:hypothetical protein
MSLDVSIAIYPFKTDLVITYAYSTIYLIFPKIELAL